ncbi:hypothetical protein INR49_022999 [Caranx melampygus]|nr:hypothetical protein INR49_022999 [Caranx melampygus]
MEAEGRQRDGGERGGKAKKERRERTNEWVCGAFRKIDGVEREREKAQTPVSSSDSCDMNACVYILAVMEIYKNPVIITGHCALARSSLSSLSLHCFYFHSLALPPSCSYVRRESPPLTESERTSPTSLYARTSSPRESPTVGPSPFRFLPPSLIHDPVSVT